jgi:hypothetical protein
LSPSCFSPPSPLSVFGRSWSSKNIANFASACSLLRSSLQIWFPCHVLPLCPALAQPCSLGPFICSLISICGHPPCFPSVPLSQSQELQCILSSLLELVIHLPSNAISPIHSLSLPPCSSAPTFVAQVTFLAHLLDRAPSAAATVEVGVQAGQQVSESALAPGHVWATAWHKWRQYSAVTAKCVVLRSKEAPAK